MTEQHLFDVEADQTNPAVTIRASGEFDAAQVQRFDAVCDEFRTAGEVVVDLSNVTLLDSSAIGALLRMHRDVTTHGGSFAVSATQPFQRKLFAVTGLSYLLKATEES